MHLEEHADDGKHGQSAVGQPEFHLVPLRGILKGVLKSYWQSGTKLLLRLFNPQYRLMLHRQYKPNVVLKHFTEG